MEDKKIVAYIKGSGKNKEGSCGCSYLLEHADSGDGEEKKDSFRMEMYALLHTLEAVKGTTNPIVIRYNYQKLIEICMGICKYHKNEDLWEKIFALIDCFGREQIKFEFMTTEEMEDKFKPVLQNARKRSVDD